MSERKYFFDNPENVKKGLRIFYVICICLALFDIFYHRHTVHPWEGLWGFYAIYGFAACVALVLIATELRKFIMRDENYYDDK
jgi:hypothetical protein